MIDHFFPPLVICCWLCMSRVQECVATCCFHSSAHTTTATTFLTQSSALFGQATLQPRSTKPGLTHAGSHPCPHITCPRLQPMHFKYPPLNVLITQTQVLRKLHGKGNYATQLWHPQARSRKTKKKRAVLAVKQLKWGLCETSMCFAAWARSAPRTDAPIQLYAHE